MRDAQAFSTIFDPSTCVRKGLCPVTDIRRQTDNPLETHSLYFEQHGTGPEKILFIMGLNSSSFSWQPQAEYFGPLSSLYSFLVFDNRGVGNSSTPKGPYTTAGMAEDAIVLLDFLGWTKKRDIHVVGVSLGGMISQELAARIPERIISLTLTVTTAGGKPWSNLPPWVGLSSLTRLLAVKDARTKVAIILNMVFPQSWLDSVDPDDPEGRTHRQVQTLAYLKRIEATRQQTGIGAISQMAAGLTHYVEPSRIRQISSSIPKVIIITGDQDHLVNPSNSKYLKANMPEAEFMQLEDTGHAVHIQRPKIYCETLERVFREGRERL